MVRTLLVLTLATAIGLGAAAYVIAGRASGPSIEIIQPAGLVGRSAAFEATVETPRGELTALDAVIEQDGQTHSLFSLDAGTDAEVRQESADRIRITRTFDRDSHPDLRAGPAQIRVSATRPVLFGLRERAASATVDVEVRLTPPVLSVVSSFHYINHGGSELVVYRVTPPDAASGVQVGDRQFPGYPAAGIGAIGDDSLRLAFFALEHDQDLTTPIMLYAEDAAGNKAETVFDHEVFPRDFRRSRIAVSDGFLREVVPAMLARVPELADAQPDGTDEGWLELYLFINGELRRRNAATIAGLAEQTSQRLLWQGPFRQLPNSQVEASFADYRTYLHDGEEIDQQVHLGFDLASTANTPILAANAGVVVFADYLGIYGNCVIVDHGMGLQSLYAHLSSVEVSDGDQVQQGQTLGRSGRTGLAAGDHLHFTMLLQGRAVTPVEWWDPHWIEDRVLRKLREISGDF